MEKLLELEKKLIEAREQLEKGLGADLNTAESREKIKHALGSIRQPAKVTDSEGNVSEVSPAKQVSDKASAAKQSKDAARAKAETEAAARRSEHRKEGVLKSEEVAPEDSNNKKTYEKIFKNNSQWTLE